MHAPSPAREVLIGLSTRKRLLQGAEILAKTVAVTYGPYGRTAMLDRLAGLLATKDGVTVAREVELGDHVANMGCQILKEACIKVNDMAGDGTTTAAIVAAAIVREAHKVIVAGVDAMQVAEGIRRASRRANEIIEEMAVPVESQHELEQVAMIASNSDEEVAKAMAEACMAVGRDGTISIEDGHGMGIELIFKDGMEIPRGVISPYFLGRNDNERVIEGPMVACIDAELLSVEDVQSVLEESSTFEGHDLIIFAKNVAGDAIKTMTLNDAKDVVRCVAIQAPGFGDRQAEFLRDIAAMAGADFIDPQADRSHLTWDSEWFGSFRKVTVGLKTATLIAYEEASEPIQERITQIRGELEHVTSDYDIERLQERMAKLTGGLCIMQIGGHTEAALKERRARVEDALGAVQSALRTGVVPGGGVAYLTAGEALESDHPLGDGDQEMGWMALARALRAPIMTLGRNAGKEGPTLAYYVSEARSEDPYGWMGWDARADVIRDLSEVPAILDPSLVVTMVIQTAASVAATLLTAETSVSFQR